MHGTSLSGVIAASITPFTDDYRIDTDKLRGHASHLLSSGCSYVSLFGTTGEGASLSTGSKLAALRNLKDNGLDMGRQIPAIMTTSFEDAAISLRAYHDLGCRAALVLPPFYYAASEEGIAAFFDALLGQREPAAGIDLLLYNIPHLSTISFSPPIISRLLKKHGRRIAGIKDSTGDLGNGTMLVESFRDLAVFTGDDRVLPFLVKKGGAGMIGGMPNIFAAELKALYDRPDDDELLARQARRIEIVDANGSLAALKAALAHYNNDDSFAAVLPPLTALGPETRSNIIEQFGATGYSIAA